MTEEHTEAYRELRVRVTALMADVDDETMALPSPATPEWTVHDVLAHLVGVTDDVVNGRLDGVATDEWTQKQVDARRAATKDEMLAEWTDNGPAFEQLLRGAPAEIAGQGLFDAATHEHDLRYALGQPDARDSAAMDCAWEWMVLMRTGGIRYVTDEGDDVIAGQGDPAATVKTSRFEILRACTGRRSASEIAAYGWDGDPQPELLIGAPFFTLRREPLNE
jgi:uncharacterized protein (TIGR03083 family)